MGFEYLTDESGDLIPQCEAALKEIFDRFDEDKDGSLSNEEIDNFAKACNGGNTLSATEKEELKNFDHTAEGNITLTGFLQMYSLQTMAAEEETWKDLKTLGYNDELQLVTKEQK